MPTKTATPDEITDFLRRFRSYWPPPCIVLDRGKNDDALGILGITPKHRKGEILSLTYKNYIAGPEADDDGSDGEVWKFNKKVKGYRIYIKLKIFKVGKKSNGICISFHPAEYPIQMKGNFNV